MGGSNPTMPWWIEQDLWVIQSLHVATCTMSTIILHPTILYLFWIVPLTTIGKTPNDCQKTENKIEEKNEQCLPPVGSAYRFLPIMLNRALMIQPWAVIDMSSPITTCELQKNTNKNRGPTGLNVLSKHPIHNIVSPSHRMIKRLAFRRPK
jgi:hypothetical protein